MKLPRRYLPSMSLLSAFEAAARHQSFTAAAGELSLTQGAVSRQIRALEDMLGAPLFLRERQKVRLTVAGEAYAEEVREALQRISAATLNLRANPQGGTLNLAILPTFGVRWLAPRLPRFLAVHPGITINLETRLEQFEFAFDNMHAAIHFGSAHWPGAQTTLLMHETVIPACSPALKEQYAFAQAEDLASAPLLHLSSRPDAWAQWFEAHETPAGDVQGMLLDQFAVAAQAASAGLGVALLPEFLIESELGRGELVKALNMPLKSAGAYYLAWPATRDAYPPLRAFRDWIVSEAGAANRPDAARN